MQLVAQSMRAARCCLSARHTFNIDTQRRVASRRQARRWWRRTSHHARHTTSLWKHVTRQHSERVVYNMNISPTRALSVAELQHSSPGLRVPHYWVLLHLMISVLTFENWRLLCNLEIDGTLFVHLFAASLMFACMICLSFSPLFLNIDFFEDFKTENLFAVYNSTVSGCQRRPSNRTDRPCY